MITYIDKETGIKRCCAGESKPKWIVKSVTPKEDCTLLLTFIHGDKKLVNIKPLIQKGGMYAKLKDTALFNKAYIDSPTVAWDDETDIAPEFLYDMGTPIG
ncbi:DUF2442 domain-containing protein [Candidatus Saccharibacteria bacterium]|nr:DUF2442 domain-containing protein [Candidatus Saccharibacteria bacterium]